VGAERSAAGRLRESRARAGLTQQRLAEQSGVSVRTIRALENGVVTRPQAASLHRLAVVLGIDPAGLMPLSAGEVRLDHGDMLRIDALGPLVVERGRRVVAVPSSRLRTMLGLLAIQPQSIVGVEEIIDTLWETSPPRTCRQLVHTYAAALRRLLGGTGGTSVLPRNEQGYRLLLGPGQSDVADFSDLVTRAERAASGAELPAWQLYAKALGCWRGPVLAGAGGWPQVHPAAIALAVYDALRERLGSQLGIDPGPEARSAQLRVLRGQLPRVAIAARSGSRSPPAQLPTDCADFTGRSEELRILDRLLAAGGAGREAPVALITGMGGVGKSALAVRWARTEQARYPDGQPYADLRGHAPAGAARPVEVIAGFLAALGEHDEHIPDDEGQAAALLRTKLTGRRMLMLLDNALDAQQVRSLLPASRGCASIVTTRDRMTGLVARDGAGLLALRPLPTRCPGGCRHAGGRPHLSPAEQHVIRSAHAASRSLADR
jgi:transcriptional regulator with XRE-family HTH domain